MEPALQPTIDTILERARAAGFEPQRVDLTPDHAVYVTYRARFRLRWVATRLHVFTFVTGIADASAQEAAAFAGWCVGYAREHKPGVPIGLQSGAAAIPIVVAARAGDDVRAWAQTQPPLAFGVMSMPVLVDASTGAATTVATRRLWGALYDSYLRDVTDAHVGSTGPRPPWPRGVKVMAAFSLFVVLLLAAGTYLAVAS